MTNPYFGERKTDAYREASEVLYTLEHAKRMNELHRIDPRIIPPKHRKVRRR